jgi:hypothetical protein
MNVVSFPKTLTWIPEKTHVNDMFTWKKRRDSPVPNTLTQVPATSHAST